MSAPSLAELAEEMRQIAVEAKAFGFKGLSKRAANVATILDYKAMEGRQ